MSHQQMRSGTPRYPVDRYLVESSNKIEMVNIMDEDLWSPSPALRPEDELALRRLHDMLHATAEDLKLLSTELANQRAPTFHLKTQPVPLDEEFNQKVHIQELVNAKFHGHKIIDPINGTPKVPIFNVTYSKPNINTGVQVNAVPVKNTSKNKNLVVTRTRILEIGEKFDKNAKNKLNNGKLVNKKVSNIAPTVVYNEYTYKHEEPKIKNTSQNKLKIQSMPSINIRSELKEQKVLQLDIYPDKEQSSEDTVKRDNVVVIAAKHGGEKPKENPKITLSNNLKQEMPPIFYPQPILIQQHPVRKTLKMSPCDSSGSTNNVSSDTQHKLKTQKHIKSVIRSSPKTSARERSKSKITNLVKKEYENRKHPNLDAWKNKLNVIYGQPSTSKSTKQSKLPKKSPKCSNLLSSSCKLPDTHFLNNSEYIPYSQLTLGGARVSDIEREISNIPNKNDIPLSPILDKILSSRENSFNKESPRKNKDSPRIFTTSDENLLEEVIDLEKKVSKTIQKDFEDKIKLENLEKSQSDSDKGAEDEKESYADDFEEDKSVNSNLAQKEESQESNKSDSDSDDSSSVDGKSYTIKKKENNRNQTHDKKVNLSIKHCVDVFEFIHSVDTQDTATQSNKTEKISLKETQTSPRNDKPNIHPIYNDLWPIDTKGEVEKMFKLEKDFIKKLIVEEYGDFLEKNISKPSTSTDVRQDTKKNVAASQKVTQTSPARVKSVMTSPARTKTRTTSPFLSVTKERHTSPMVVVTDEENITLEVDKEEDCISINLSSPRFNLKLPQSSREVLSNLEGGSGSPTKTKTEERFSNVTRAKTFRKYTTSSSSEVENSSEMSSLGEIKYRLKRRYRKRISSISESSESSLVSKSSSDLPSGEIIPLKSEGEVSFKQVMRNASNKSSKSEGEASIGRTKTK